jgi:excisionase family DNA binding protein
VTIDRTTAIDDLPQLLRIDEAAAWLGCSTGVVREMARQESAASVRIGRLVRVRRSWLATLAGAPECLAG